MKVLNKDDKVSLYGNLNIKILSKKMEKNICISIENHNVSEIGDSLYKFLQKYYEQYDYNWLDINKKTKTTKIMVDNEVINTNCSINIYGYVEDWRGLSSEDGKKYDFYITDIDIKDMFEELELLYDEYICDFDTVKEGLKFVIEKIEIK